MDEGKSRLLLVDDSKTELQILNEALVSDRRSVFSCMTKADAISIPPEMFTAVVIDVLLPDASSSDSTLAIVHHFGASKCVVHTAVSQKMEIIAEIAKHCRVVQKNADLTEICQAVEEIENAS